MNTPILAYAFRALSAANCPTRLKYIKKIKTCQDDMSLFCARRFLKLTITGRYYFTAYFRFRQPTQTKYNRSVSCSSYQ